MLADRVLPFLIKSTGLAAQLITMLVLVELLGAVEFGIYAAAISIGVVVAVATDIGFTRYSFRLINRGVPLYPVLARSLAMRLWLTLIALLLTIPVAVTTGVPVLAIAVAILANTASQISNFHRYLAISKDRVSEAIAIEITAPLLYLGTMLLCAVLSMALPAIDNISAITALVIYATSYLGSLAVWAYRLAVHDQWYLALTSLPARPATPAALRRTVRRSVFVGTEQLTSSLWYNMPVLLAAMFGGPLDRAVAGIFQRLWNVVIAFVSTAQARVLSRYYKRLKPVTEEIRLIMLQSALLFVVILASFGLYQVVYAKFLSPLADRSETIRLLPALFAEPILLIVAIMLMVAYVRLSFLALGNNERSVRSLASAVGAALLPSTVLIWQAVVPGSTVSILELCISGLVVGHLAAAGIILQRLRRYFKEPSGEV